MSSSKPPEVAIGMVDGLWTVAIADQFGWVKAGTGDPLHISVVGWTELVPIDDTETVMTEDNRITQIREVMRHWDRPHDLDRRTALERIRAILGPDTEAHLRLPIAAPLAGIPGREHHIVTERPECNADTCECES